LKTLLAIIGIFFGIIPNCDGAVCMGQLTLKAELPTIRKAAERNGIKYGSDDWYLLLAIRKQENGRDGCEFGIADPRAWETNLDTQAGWAAATIVKQHKRYGSDQVTLGYVLNLADRYCPASCDPDGNRNWKRNVWYWFNKFQKGCEL
jgi:hypothetical protein